MTQDSAIVSLVSEVRLFTSPMMPLSLCILYKNNFISLLNSPFPFIFKICHLMDCLEYSNEVFGSATCFFFYDYFIFVRQF